MSDHIWDLELGDDLNSIDWSAVHEAIKNGPFGDFWEGEGGSVDQLQPGDR
jgi:hypothetical protein